MNAYVDLPMRELLAAPGLVGGRLAKYHEAAVHVGEAVILPLDVAPS
jgi:hypothetical protein